MSKKMYTMKLQRNNAALLNSFICFRAIFIKSSSQFLFGEIFIAINLSYFSLHS